MIFRSASAITQSRHLPLVVVAAITVSVAIAAIAAKLCIAYGLTWPCPALVLLGLPCPGCGGTRALAALAQLRFAEALFFNPLIVLSLAAVLLAPFFKVQISQWGRGASVTIGIAVFLNWLYLLCFLPR